jgi:hypothetical protein
MVREAEQFLPGITILQSCLCLLIKAVAGEPGGHDGFPVIYVMRSIVKDYRNIQCMYL